MEAEIQSSNNKTIDDYIELVEQLNRQLSALKQEYELLKEENLSLINDLIDLLERTERTNRGHNDSVILPMSGMEKI